MNLQTALLVVMLSWASACGGSTAKEALDIEATLSPAAPAAMTDATVSFTIKHHADGSVAEGAQVTVTPWHVAMNHGSTKPVVVTDQGQGAYSATPVYFQMAGDWEVRIQATHGPDHAGTKTLAVTVK